MPAACRGWGWGLGGKCSLAWVPRPLAPVLLLARLPARGANARCIPALRLSLQTPGHLQPLQVAWNGEKLDVLRARFQSAQRKAAARKAAASPVPPLAA